MAVETAAHRQNNEESDYGSDLDLDNDTWDDLFSQSESQPPPGLPACINSEEIEEEAVLPDDDSEQLETRSLRLARIRENLHKAIVGLRGTSGQLEKHRWSGSEKVEIEYGADNRGSFATAGVKSESAAEELQQPRSAEPEPPISNDTRSPLERFRTKPKKPLSVTDIVSPAWCELQYWYNLTRYGRVKRTPAMKAGSKIHKEKEREVHVEVQVEITTKEDRLGLRLWNIIGGLRTLRATGLTRELEVLGLVDGEVMIGIIDEVSQTCPDENMEQKILGAKEDGKKNVMDKDQTTMSDFIGGNAETRHGWQRRRPPPPMIYLTDIKTRGSKSVPKLEGQLRATKMQLMLYRRLLNDLAANNVEADPVFDRYNVDPHARFSDSFIAQLAEINLPESTQPERADQDDSNDEPFCRSSSQPRNGEADPLDEVLQHQTLSSLWALMISEFSKTISVNAVSSSISALLTAEFRGSKDGSLIGRQSFKYEEDVLEAYVAEEMRWWRGERSAKGVEIEESYKCGICEFAEKCEWRIEKDKEAGRKARAKRGSKSQT